MRYRMAAWAIVGFVVAGCWAFMRSQGLCHFGLHFYWVLAANAATYALLGLIMETLRQRMRSISNSNWT